MATYSLTEALEHLGGSPDAIAAELGQFAEAAKVLSSNHPRLIDEHPRLWVGVFQGQVRASADSLEALMALLERDGVPRERAIVRFIDRDEKVLIL